MARTAVRKARAGPGTRKARSAGKEMAEEMAHGRTAASLDGVAHQDIGEAAPRAMGRAGRNREPADMAPVPPM